MYKKITVIIYLLLAGLLVYLHYSYFQYQSLTASTNTKIILMNKATDNFSNIGFIICIISLLLANITAFKTKQLFWLLMPFVCSILVAWAVSCQAEDIFIFNKNNGRWKGGFSLSYFLGIAITLFAVLILMLNYFILKKVIKK